MTTSFTSSGVLLVGDYCRVQMTFVSIVLEKKDITLDEEMISFCYGKENIVHLKTTSSSTAAETLTTITVHNRSLHLFSK